MKEQSLADTWTPPTWIEEHKTVWRKAVLLLFLFCLLSPWTMDRMHVPAPNECSWRVDDDFCASPLSGFWALFAGYGIVLDSVPKMMSGASSNAARSLPQIVWIFWIVITPLPAFSTLLLLRSHGRFWPQRFQVVLWALVAGAGVVSLFSAMGWPLLRLWGIWSYVLLSVAALFLEAKLWLLQRNRTPSRSPV